MIQGINVFFLLNVLESFEDIWLIHVVLLLEEISISIGLSSSLIKLYIITGFFFLFGLSSLNIANFLNKKKWSIFMYQISQIAKNIIKDGLGKKGEKYYPFFFFIFLFIFFANLFGLIPFTYSLTSQLLITLILAYTVFGGILIISLKKQSIGFLNHFMPSGTSIYLSPLLVPVEILSYLFRPLSLGIRLFANIMAGHTLLKVITGFSWALLNFSLVMFFVPLSAIVILYILELAVAIIQTYVFGVLTVVYLNDSTD